MGDRPEVVSEYAATKTIAAQFDVTERFVRMLIADGTLPAYRVGKRLLRVKRSDVDAILQPVRVVADQVD